MEYFGFLYSFVEPSIIYHNHDHFVIGFFHDVGTKENIYQTMNKDSFVMNPHVVKKTNGIVIVQNDGTNS